MGPGDSHSTSINFSVKLGYTSSTEVKALLTSRMYIWINPVSLGMESKALQCHNTAGTLLRSKHGLCLRYPGPIRGGVYKRLMHYDTHNENKNRSLWPKIILSRRLSSLWQYNWTMKVGNLSRFAALGRLIWQCHKYVCPTNAKYGIFLIVCSLSSKDGHTKLTFCPTCPYCMGCHPET